MTTYFVILLLLGTMGLWDYATTRPTKKRNSRCLIVSSSRCLFWAMGKWDYGTMGRRGHQLNTASQTPHFSPFTFHLSSVSSLLLPSRLVFAEYHALNLLDLSLEALVGVDHVGNGLAAVEHRGVVATTYRRADNRQRSLGVLLR